MSDDNNNETNTPLTTAPVVDTELEVLKSRAILLNIKFHPKIKAEALSKKIDESLRDDGKSKEATIVEEQINVRALGTGRKQYLTPDEFKKKTRITSRRSAGKLIRVRITCMNPTKKDWEGEILSVGSAKLGTFKKFIPFNNDEPYHIPQIIYDALKERKCSSFYTVKGSKGGTVRKSRLITEFGIEVLPPLTSTEIKELIQRQALAGSIKEDF